MTLRPTLLAATTLLLAACDPGTVEEAVDLASEGGLIELRDTLRPIRGGPRVLVFGLDGVGEAPFREALGGGKLPRLAALVGIPEEAAPAADGDGLLEHGWVAPDVVAVHPSITLAAWTALFTGTPPAENGVPGNEWFDRDANAFRAPAPVSVSGNEDALASLTEGRMGEWIATPTLFERADVRSHVSMLHVHRGADVLTVPSAGDLVELLGAFPEGVVSDEPVKREVYSELDQASAESAADAIEEHGVPDLQVVYFPGVDLFTHATPDPEARQLAYLTEVLDPAIGAVLDAYRRAGALEGTWIVVVADHGHTAVPSDDRHALGGSPSSPAALLDTLGWRVRPPELEVDEDADHQAVVAYQGAFAYLYLADRASCPGAGTPCAWSRPPAREDVDAVAEAFHRDADADGVATVLLPRRGADGRLEGVDAWTDDGPVPLEGDPPGAAAGLVRFQERLGWLLDGPRGRLAGDVILMARSGAWLPREERFYFSHPYHSWHGSAHEEDSRVPLLVARPGATGSEVRARVRGALSATPSQLDVTGLILDLLEVDEEGGPGAGGQGPPAAGAARGGSR